jgi:hypothetical protein
VTHQPETDWEGGTDRKGDTDWEALWSRLLRYTPDMTPQGREYLRLAQRLVRANRALAELADLEDEAYQELQGVAMLLRSVGGPEEGWLVQLLSLITHLIDMLYVRLEYAKWEISPLSELSAAIADIGQEDDLTDQDRAVLGFLAEYDAAVRSGMGLFDQDTLARLQDRADALESEGVVAHHRRLRALADLVSKFLRYNPDDDWLT